MLLLLGVAVGGLSSGVSLGLATDTGSSESVVNLDSLAPPTGVAASGGTSISLTWTASSSTSVSGYLVLRGTSSGGPYSQVGTVGPTATSMTDTPTIAGTYYYTLQSTFESWTSGLSTQASGTFVPPGLTISKVCTAQAADTGGDGDGYEVSAANVCADDGQLAQDVNSGTSNSASCTSTAKDRHRFSTYAFGLPALATINGIAVRVRSAISSTKGSSLICSQLSWDGGTTWTAVKSLTLVSASPSFYVFGSNTDVWGRAWTVANFSDANFRVRVIDAANNTTKTYSLDSVQVTITYLP
jgi:hypothetical protein